jgi:hypothetical protein
MVISILGAMAVKMFGDEASLLAAQRADKAIDQGDPKGERVWQQIMRAVDELQRNERDTTKPLH